MYRLEWLLAPISNPVLITMAGKSSSHGASSYNQHLVYFLASAGVSKAFYLQDFYMALQREFFPYIMYIHFIDLPFNIPCKIIGLYSIIFRGAIFNCLLGWYLLQYNLWRILLFVICIPGLYAYWEHQKLGVRVWSICGFIKRRERLSSLSISCVLKTKDSLLIGTELWWWYNLKAVIISNTFSYWLWLQQKWPSMGFAKGWLTIQK